MSIETWALLWSKKQNCFHIEPATALFSKNLRAMDENKTLNDYHVIHVGSREACDHLAADSRQMLQAREVNHV